MSDHVEQPTPVPNNSEPIQDLVMRDIGERKRLGIERYGVALQAGNGRDMLRDAYEEALDLAIYLRGAIAERDAPRVPEGAAQFRDRGGDLWRRVPDNGGGYRLDGTPGPLWARETIEASYGPIRRA
jgi:hypothetical protein